MNHLVDARIITAVLKTALTELSPKDARIVAYAALREWTARRYVRRTGANA